MRPQTISPAYDHIPSELTEQPIWVAWEYRLDEKGKWTKVPLVADRSRRLAASSDRTTWRTFEQAKNIAPTVSGLGLCVVDNYVGFDLDCCRNKETEGITLWAERIIERINSYTEVSPSGEGVRIIARLSEKLPQPARRKRGSKENLGWEIAIYPKESARYLCMTGVIVGGRNQIRTVDPDTFYPEFARGGFDPEPPKTNGEKAGAHKKVNKRERLMRGEWKDLYGSQSEADAALVWILAREHNNDIALIDQASLTNLAI